MLTLPKQYLVVDDDETKKPRRLALDRRSPNAVLHAPDHMLMEWVDQSKEFSEVPAGCLRSESGLMYRNRHVFGLQYFQPNPNKLSRLRSKSLIYENSDQELQVPGPPWFLAHCQLYDSTLRHVLLSCSLRGPEKTNNFDKVAVYSIGI